MLAAIASLFTAIPNATADTIIAPTEDVMTSAFFQGTNLVRGYNGEANRPNFRVSNDNAFGVGPETIYVQFSAGDFSGMSSVDQAILTMESVDGGFGANASAGDPFIVSAHGVNADPFTEITDDTNPSGTIAWDDFFANNILTANAAALTTVDAFGPVEFDVTSLVNDWLAGGNPHFVIALTGKNDPQLGNGGNGFLHGFRNNSNTAANEGFTFLTVSAIPEPGSMFIIGCVGVVAAIRRRK